MLNENISPNLPRKEPPPLQKSQEDTTKTKKKYAGPLQKLPQISKDETKKLSRSLKTLVEKEIKADKPQTEEIIFQQLAQIPAAAQPLIPLSFPATLPPPEAKSVAQAAQPVISVMEARRLKIAEALKQANLTHFKEEELKVISSFLVHYELADTLIDHLSSPPQREKGLRLLQTALLHSLLTASVKESLIIMGLYRTLFPIQEEKGESLIKLKNIALVLGDAFIHDSGYEGGISPRPFANLAVDLLNTTSTSYTHADALKYMLKNHINLREDVSVLNLSETIKKTLSACPGETRRCLLSGGWAEHAIEYEIEKKTDGRYAFRVYNEGEGIRYHENINANHKIKFAGSIAIDDIPEELLFQPAFLASLQALCSVNGEKAPKLLVQTILPLLGGKEEALAPEIQQYLSPQRSGVCTYRSLQAFIAHALPAEEYKKFKFEYKLFLLDKYLPLLESKAKQKIKTKNYWDTVKEHALLKRCLEKFSNGIANLSPSLAPAEIEKAHVTLLEYKFFIDKLERRLLAYEKTSTQPLPTKSDALQTFFAPDEPLKIQDPSPTSAISSKKLSWLKEAMLNAIQQIPPADLEPVYSEAIENCIASFKLWPLSPDDRWQMLDLFFKKVGSFDAISRLHFSHPQDTLTHLHALLSHLIGSADAQELDQIGMYYGCYALYEQAFRQLPDASRVLSPHFPSFLKNVDLNLLLRTATCCDPYWVSRFYELQELQQKESRPALFVPDISKKSYESSTTNFALDNTMSKEMVAWWSDAKRPWNIEVPNAQDLKIEYAESLKELSAKKGKLEQEIDELRNKVAESQKVLQEGDFLNSLAQSKVEIAKKHSEITSYLLSKCAIDETSLKADKDFMQAWEELNTTPQQFIIPGTPGYSASQEKRRKEDQQKLILILSKIEGKSRPSVSSLEDLDFIKTLTIKKAELDKLLKAHNKALSIPQLKTLEIQLFQKQAEGELLSLEMDHLQQQQEEKLTPLSLSLSQDRLQQQKATKRELSELKTESLRWRLAKQYGDLEIQLNEHMLNIYEQETNFPFMDRNTITTQQSKLPYTPLSEYVTEFFKSEIASHSQKISFDPPVGLSECKSQRDRLVDGMKDVNSQDTDLNALAISQLEGHPNKYDFQKQYWPYGWEKGELSDSSMASFLYGSKPEFLQNKLKSNAEIIPPELKQLYHHAILVRHYSGQKAKLPDPILPIEGYQLKAPYSPLPLQMLKVESDFVLPPKPFIFNQYKRLEGRFGNYFTVFADKIPEENIHSQLGPLYSFNDPRGVPLSPEEFIDLASLHQSTIQIEAALNYFEEHADLLSKPEWVEALHYLLFEKNILLNELQDPTQGQRTVTKINNFFNHLMTQADRLADFNLMGNLLWTKSLIQSYIDHVNVSNATQNKPPLPQIISPAEISECLKKVLQTTISSDTLRVFFEACTAASGLFDLKNCSREDLGYILLANLLKNLFPVQQDPIALRARHLEKTNFNIQKLFTEKPDLKASEFFLAGHWQVLKKIYTNIDELQQDPSQPDALVNKDQSLRVCFSAGRIQSSDPTFLHRYENPLTLSQKEKFKFWGLFTEESELSQLRCCYHGNEVFIKKLPDGPLFTLRKKTDSSAELPYMKILLPNGKSVWGEWMTEREAEMFLNSISENQGITASNHCFAISSGTKKEKTYKFLASGEKTFVLGNDVPDTNFVICDKVHLKPCYMTVEHSNPKDFRTTKLNTGLLADRTLIDIKTGHRLTAPSQTFGQFEELHHTCYWADDTHTLQKIDFPRYNLTFRKQKDHFICEQYPGWNLDNEQFAPHLNPTTGFMRLSRKDEKTKKNVTKVLIPLLDAQEMEKDRKGVTARALNFPYEYDFKSQKKTPTLSYCEYDLVDQSLQPKTLEARYHLANIYLQKGYQDDAEALLFDPAAEVTTRPLTLQERSLLKKIIYKPQSTETSGRILRLKMHALYLLERDGRTRGGEIERVKTLEASKMNERRTILIQEYLSRLNHIKRLDEREENLLISSQNNKQNNTSIPINKPEPLSMTLPARDLKDKSELSKIAETMEQTAEFRDKIHYVYARRAGTFPFEFKDPISMRNEFPKYISLLKEECRRVADLEAARNNGLIPMLFYLANFAERDNVKDIAKMLLNEIPRLNPLETTPVKKTGIYEVKKKPLPVILEASQSLVLLKEVKASNLESSYLPHTCARYLQQKPYPAITPNDFDENHPKAQTDPAVKAEFIAINENIHTASALLQAEKKYVLLQENLPDLLNEVKETHELQKQALKSQEVFILQNITSALLSDSISGLLFSSGKKQLPALEELCLLCARLTAEDDLQKAYPQLSAEGRKHLIGAIQEYLIQKRFVQHLEGVQGKISEIMASTKNKTLSKAARNLMIQELGKSMAQPPAFDAYQDPLARVYLTLETTLNIKLRQEQVDTISKFNDSIRDGQDITIQMIMGGGKTSVIQPILAFLLAKKGALSTVYVPAALYEAVKSGLEKSLGNSFQQFVYADPFTKDLSKDVAYLKTYLNRLREAKDRQAVVLLTPQHKYALYSALKEAYAENQPYRCDLLADICRECLQTETAQIDEIDTCIDPTVVYKFPIGKSRMIDRDRAKIVTELVLELANDEAFSKKVSIDFIDAYKLRKNEKYKVQGKAISAELFESEIKPLLIQKAELLLAQHILEYTQIKAQDDQSYISHFLNKSTPYDQAIRKQCTPEKEDFLRERLENNQLKGLPSEDLPALQLIKNKLNFEKERNAWIETHFGIHKQLAAICAKAINTILKQSLLKECGSNYFHDPELETKGIFTARPYLAPNSPKSSIPSDSYELAIYSMQNLLFNGATTKAVEKILAQWRKEALMAGNNISASPSYREYQRLMGHEAQRFTLTEDPPQKELIDLLQKKLSKDPQALLDFMEKYVFRQIVDFEKSISTTPLAGLTGFNKQRIGYTGTVNPGILPRSMQIYREKGTEGKILLVIDNKLEKDISHIYEFTKDQKEYTEQLIDQFKAEADLFTFIDSGNWLKDVHLKQWLEKLVKEVSAKRPEIQGLLYPDEKGQWLSLEKDSSTGIWMPIPLERSALRPEQRLTIIPSKHETGTDIKQPPTARALNSIRKGMTLRDALQSVFRMRELFAGQKIDFALSKEVSEHMDPLGVEEISAETLGAYLLVNQIEDSFTKNEMAALHGFYETLEVPVRKRLLDTQLPYAQRKELFTALENLFIAKKIDDPFEEVCQEKRIVPQEKGVAYHINKILDLLDFKNPLILDIYQSREDLKQKLLAAVDVKTLPKTLTIGGSHDAHEIEIDIDIEKEQQQQQEQQIEMDRDIEIHALNRYLSAYNYLPLAPLATVDSGYVPRDLLVIKSNPIDTLLPETVKPLFQQDEYSLEFSDNLFPTKALASEYYLPGRFVLILKNAGQKDRIVLVSHKDADLIKQGMLKDKQKLAAHQSIALISLDGQLSASVPEEAVIDLEEASLQRAIVQAKLLTGKVRFTEPELTLLEEDIIKKQGLQHVHAAVELGNLYESILAWMPDSAKLYPISPIKTLFKKYQKHKTSEIAQLYNLGKNYIAKPEGPEDRKKYLEELEPLVPAQSYNRDYFLSCPLPVLASYVQLWKASSASMTMKSSCAYHLAYQLALASTNCPHLSQEEKGVLKLLSLCCSEMAAGRSCPLPEVWVSLYNPTGPHHNVIQDLLGKADFNMQKSTQALKLLSLLLNPLTTEDFLQSTGMLSFILSQY